jgi:methyl-accepting chemotaxis protein
MDEQVRANREFGKGLAERETQVQAINEATRFQLATAQRVFSHFASSEKRLSSNAAKAEVILQEIARLEKLAGLLREQAGAFQQQGKSVAGQTAR